jgi:hypothetical protein
MISAAAVSTISLTYVSGGSWAAFNSTNLATAGNLQANWTDIASQVGASYKTLLNSAVNEIGVLEGASGANYIGVSSITGIVSATTVWSALYSLNSSVSAINVSAAYAGSAAYAASAGYAASAAGNVSGILTATGDILYASAANAPTRLAKGTELQMLRLNGDATAPEWFSNPSCRVYNSVSQSIPDSAFTTLNFDTESYDNDTMHDNVTNNERITFSTAGTYKVSANIAFAANATGNRIIKIIRNDGEIKLYENKATVTTGDSTVFNVSFVATFSAGQYVYIQAYQSSTGALGVNRSADYSAIFAAEKIM